MYLSLTKLPGSGYRKLECFVTDKKEQELVWKAQQYRLDIVEVSTTKRWGSGAVELNGGGNFCTQVLLQQSTGNCFCREQFLQCGIPS